VAIAFIGLGSNLAQPVQQVQTALSELDALEHTRCLRHSSLYRSAPMGPQDQPDYINAVAQLDTDLEPLALLQALQTIEARHQRLRQGERWGPRTLDLDLLLYDDRQIDLPQLTVPHAGLYERNFVLYPLAEIVEAQGGDLAIPGRGMLSALVARCERGSLEPIGGLEPIDENSEGTARAVPQR
jgi:2-amino-4-hydroxy-6-hydroxymethyldihydropteridine diphosphokinase